MRMKYLLLFLLAIGRLNAQSYQPTWDSLDKHPMPAWYTDAKFGIFTPNTPPA
jgi:alpha-L-fucosidase